MTESRNGDEEKEEERKMGEIRTAEDLERALVGALVWGEWDGIAGAIGAAHAFGDTGLLTRDRGVVVRLTNRAEFQVTIVRSGPPEAPPPPREPAHRCPECGRGITSASAFIDHLVDDHGMRNSEALWAFDEQDGRDDPA